MTELRTPLISPGWPAFAEECLVHVRRIVLYPRMKYFPISEMLIC